MSAIRWSGRLVELGVDPEAVEVEVGAARRVPTPMVTIRIPRSAASGRPRSGRARSLFSPSLSRTITRRRRRCRVDRRGRRRSGSGSGCCSSRPACRRCAFVDRVERGDDALPDATCRAAGIEALDGREDVGLVAGRRLDRDARVAERDDPDDDARAAALRRCVDATSSRPPSGSAARSSAAMLPETSNASITVPSSRGSATVACGRASAIASTTNPATSRAPRQDAAAAVRGDAARPTPPPPPIDPARAAPPPAPGAGLDRARREHAERDQQRAAGAAPARERHARPRRRRLRRGRHPDDRPHEVVVGRERSRPRRPPGRSARSSSASRAAAASANRSRNLASWVSTISCSPVSASWTTIGPTSGSVGSRGSTSRTASSSWRRLSRCERPLPAGLADEVGHDHDQRPPPDRRWPASSSAREVGDRRAGRACGSAIRSSIEAQDRDPAAAPPGSSAPRPPAVARSRRPGCRAG